MYSFSDLVKNSNFNFVKNIDLHQFPKVNQYEEKYSFNCVTLITGVAIALFSAFIGWKILGGLFALAFLYKSIHIIKVETKEYKIQAEEIHRLLRPFIGAFVHGYRLKAESVRNAMKEIRVTSHEKAGKAIKLLAKIYDREAEPAEWEYGYCSIENTTDDKTYRLVKMTAEKLIAFNLDDVACNAVVIKEMIRLKNSAYFFMYGIGGCDDYINQMAVDLIPYGKGGCGTSYVHYTFNHGTLTVSNDPAIMDYIY